MPGTELSVLLVFSQKFFPGTLWDSERTIKVHGTLSGTITIMKSELAPKVILLTLLGLLQKTVSALKDIFQLRGLNSPQNNSIRQHVADK